MGEPVLLLSTEDGKLSPESEAVKFIKDKYLLSNVKRISSIGVIQCANSKWKFPLANIFLRFLNHPDKADWMTTELSGFPCDDKEEIMMWNNPLFIDSENYGEKIALVMLAGSINQLNGDEVGLDIATFVGGICSTVVFVLGEDDDPQKADDFICQVTMDKSRKPDQQLYLLVYTRHLPYGKSGGKHYLSKLKKSNKTSLISNCWTIPVINEAHLEQPIKDQNVIRVLNNLISDVFDPGALFPLDPLEFWNLMEKACEKISTSDAAVIIESFEHLEVSNQTESQIRQLLDHKTNCYEIYVELMKGSLPKKGTFKNDDITNWHKSAMDSCIRKFVAECERDAFHENDIQTQKDYLSREIEEFRDVMIESAKFSLPQAKSRSSIVPLIQAKLDKKKEEVKQIWVNYQTKKPLTVDSNKDKFLQYLAKKGISQAVIYKHPAIISALHSHEMSMSMNTGYIYLLGASGQGKSSTINFLFGKEILKTGRGTSMTTDTVEHIAPVQGSRLFIKNMKISIIDGPGLEDSSGKDEMHLACHRKFMDTHPEFCGNHIFPNVIMIVHKITDDRLGSITDYNTIFIKTLRRIRSTLASKLMDPRRPAVIFVLTSLQSVPDDDVHSVLESQSQSIKELSDKYLKISNPPIVAVENYPGKCRLKQDQNGWFVLKNGDKHPLTLFSKLIDLCDKNDDLIGKEAISRYFSQPVNPREVTKGHFVNGSDVALTKHGIKVIEEIDIAPGDSYNQLDVKVGYGYDIFRDASKAAIVHLGSPVAKGPKMICVPEHVIVREQNKTFSRCLEFCSVQKYVETRWADLKVNVDIPLEKLNLAKISVRAGYSVNDETNSSSNSSEKTILIERYVYKMHVEQLEPTDGFRRDVNRLPLDFDHCDDSNMAKWTSFLDRYGTHLVLEAWAGGSCTATISCQSSEDSRQTMHNLLGEIQFRLSTVGADAGATGEIQSSSENKTSYNTATIEMDGGDVNFHSTNIQQMDPIRMEKWLASIQTNPTVLTSQLGLESIGCIISTINPQLVDPFYKAYKFIYGGSLPAGLTAQIKASDNKQILDATSREDATARTGPNMNILAKIRAKCIIL